MFIFFLMEEMYLLTNQFEKKKPLMLLHFKLIFVILCPNLNNPFWQFFLGFYRPKRRVNIKCNDAMFCPFRNICSFMYVHRLIQKFPTPM